MSFFIRGIFIGGAIGIIITIMAVGVLWALEKEMHINQSIKESRCSSYGENIPSTLEGYCAGVGV